MLPLGGGGRGPETPGTLQRLLEEAAGVSGLHKKTQWGESHEAENSQGLC